MEKRLKITRKHAGLTQPQLAVLIGVSPKSIKNYEKDASKIAVNKVKKIALVCGVDEVWLLTGHGKMIADTIDHASKVVREHQNLVKRFKNPERGLSWNERLIDIEDASEDLCEKVDIYLQGVHDAAKVMIDAKSGNCSAPSSGSNVTGNHRKKPKLPKGAKKNGTSG